MAREPVLVVAEQVVTLDRARPEARAVLVADGRITWVGDDPDAAPPGARRIDLDGAVLQPGFVDAHVHLTATGLTLAGLDLGDCRSVADCLAAVRQVAEITPGRVIWGGGWDDVGYPEDRPPTADELSSAAGGRPVLLTRADGHSAVVDRVTLEAAPLERVEGVERDASGRPTGLLRRDANHLALRWFLSELSDAELARARQTVATHAAGLGITSVHEMAGPDLMGERDFDTWREGEWPIEVVAYWGAPDLDFIAARGLRRLGELFLDGSLGSRTAALSDDYADGPGHGFLYEADDDLVELLLEATRRSVQVAFHCIGDEAVRQAVRVLEATASQVGLGKVRRARHRLEHCEMVPTELYERIGRYGVVVSTQPAFDQRWGRPGGLYERRLGAERARGLNPWRPLVAQGVTLAFGSDANVTPLDPWGMVAAAVGHHRRDFALDRDAALRAAVLGGRAAARQREVGAVRVGERADLAAFALHDGAPGGCVWTMTRGTVVHGNG